MKIAKIASQDEKRSTNFNQEQLKSSAPKAYKHWLLRKKSTGQESKITNQAVGKNTKTNIDTS